MLFTSYEFIAFLLILFVVYYLIPKRFQWMLLLAANYIFYFFSGPKFLIYILTTTVSAYIAGNRIHSLHEEQAAYLAENKGRLSREDRKEYKAAIKSRQWKWLLYCLLLNFGILAVIKYANFGIANVNYLLQAFGSGSQISFLKLALPMGISFYTFQTMGYMIDVYRGKYPPEKNIFKLALFVSFFPQLVQGPISRFDDLSETLYKEHDFDYRNVSFGLQRILWGFFKKVVLADRMLVAVKTLIQDPETYQGAFALVGMLFYAFQLYADFTGGIDITIGIGQVLGIKLKENFNRPYFSKNITEYWRRWHISLGSWFREYLFYPISVWKPMLNFTKWCRKTLGEAIGRRIPIYISSIVVWAATGIWHGASWNFFMWGMANCFVIILSQELQPFYTWFHNKFDVKHKFGFRLFQVVRTVLLMSSIRMFDCYVDVPTTFRAFWSMFTVFNYHELFNGSLLNLGLSLADYLVLLMGLVVLVTVSLIQRTGSVRAKLAAKPHMVRYALYYGMIIVIIVLGAYGVGYDSSQFIYNQF